MLGTGGFGAHSAKKVLKRWDDVEERLLAENVRAWGAKARPLTQTLTPTLTLTLDSDPVFPPYSIH